MLVNDVKTNLVHAAKNDAGLQHDIFIVFRGGKSRHVFGQHRDQHLYLRGNLPRHCLFQNRDLRQKHTCRPIGSVKIEVPRRPFSQIGQIGRLKVRKMVEGRMPCWLEILRYRLHYGQFSVKMAVECRATDARADQNMLDRAADIAEV